MKNDLKLEILEKLSSLITAGFGLVAALAWNDAIKEVISAILPQPSSALWGKLIYALIVTILVVIITVNLGKIINRLKESIDSKKKDEQR
jgi:Mg2+/citrate symporter